MRGTIMSAIFRAVGLTRQHEQDYIGELASIRWEIEFLEDFIDESRSHRSLAPMVEDLRERELLIKRALLELELPPMPDAMRHPFTRRRTPDEEEYIMELIKKHSGRRKKPVLAE
jgi:hypothetical protein